MTDVNGKPPPERDLGARTRLDAEAFHARDLKVRRLLEAGWSQRAIAARLYMSTGTMQEGGEAGP